MYDNSPPHSHFLFINVNSTHRASLFFFSSAFAHVACRCLAHRKHDTVRIQHVVF